MKGSQTEIESVRAQIDEVLKELDALVVGLSDEQLRWSPGQGRWSIVDCLEHLNVSGGWFTKQMGFGIRQGRERGWTDPGHAFRPRPFDRLYAWILEPPVRRLKAPAPAASRPQRQASPAEVVSTFRKLQETIRERLQEAEGLDLRRARARSPFSKHIRFSLGGCFRVALAHERRHLWQARQVRDAPGFPAS